MLSGIMLSVVMLSVMAPQALKLIMTTKELYNTDAKFKNLCTPYFSVFVPFSLLTFVQNKCLLYKPFFSIDNDPDK
jgi:hypothetical protein